MYLLHSCSTSDEKSEKLGYFYALSYIIIGIAAIVIWIVKSDEAVCNHIVTISQVLLGMMVAIVTGYCGLMKYVDSKNVENFSQICKYEYKKNEKSIFREL
ncbi:MAG: hypothetical protein KA341_16670 [Saprospiraceae bacterium]|nr:hypothetical protein [Saprospiraceae bacterium]